MPAILDLATLLLNAPAGSGNTSGTPLLLYPRQLATCAWVVEVLTAPSASCLFSLAVASTEAGVYTAISSWTWPAAETGRKQLGVGLQGHMAQAANNTALWVRCSVATAGTFGAMSWISKASDGGPGLGSRSYALDAINPF
jgi:hypothetical protein